MVRPTAYTITVTSCPLVCDQIRLYPNPSSTEVIIKGTKILKADLLSSQGACLKHYDIGGSDNPELDLSGIASGIYILKIYTGKGDVTKKLIVSK